MDFFAVLNFTGTFVIFFTRGKKKSRGKILSPITRIALAGSVTSDSTSASARIGVTTSADALRVTTITRSPCGGTSVVVQVSVLAPVTAITKNLGTSAGAMGIGASAVVFAGKSHGTGAGAGSAGTGIWVLPSVSVPTLLSMASLLHVSLSFLTVLSCSSINRESMAGKNIF